MLQSQLKQKHVNFSLKVKHEQSGQHVLEWYGMCKECVLSAQTNPGRTVDEKVFDLGDAMFGMLC